MRTTLTQRIAAAESLLNSQRAKLRQLTRQSETKTRRINELVANNEGAQLALNRASKIEAAREEGLRTISKLSGDLADALTDNDTLQARLAVSESRMEAIYNVTHPWYMVFIHPKNCPICLAQGIQR